MKQSLYLCKFTKLLLISVITPNHDTLMAGYKLLNFLLICNIFCGFSSVRFKKRRVRCIVNSYCWIITVIFIIICFIRILVSVNSGEMVFKSMFLLTMYTALHTYYRVNYILSPDVYRSVLANIYSVDTSLTKLFGVNKRLQNNTVCLTIYSSVITFHVVYIYKYVTAYANVLYKGSHPNMSSYVALIYNMSMYVCGACFITQFVVVVDMLKQRLCQIRCGIDEIEKFNNTRIYVAWTRRCSSVPTFGRRRITSVADKQCHFETLRKLYGSIYDAFHGVQKFYRVFFAVHFALYIHSYSFQLYRCLLHGRLYDTALLTVKAVINFVLPMFVCVSCTREFTRTVFSINSVYFADRLHKCVQRKTKPWMGAADSKFSIGFVDIDVHLISVVWDFVTVLVVILLEINY